MRRLLKQINRRHDWHHSNIVSSITILISMWAIPDIPYQQDYTLFLIPAGAGLIIGILALLIILLLLLIWFRSRQKAARSVDTHPTPPSETPTIPGDIKKKDKDDTRPSPAVTDAETVESPGLTVGSSLTVPTSGERPASINWQIAGLTDVGLKRDLNEDALLMIETETPDLGAYGLYAVADGMGGHEKGEVASQLTLNTLQQNFLQQPPLPTDDTPFETWLNTATLAANQMVLERQDPESPEKKMGSTLVMAIVTGQQVYIANVGDSRAYHITDEGITQISEDHSLVERLIQIGQITREEARHHRQKNVIYNTIGDKTDPQVGQYNISLQPGDRLLLCSDGLNNMITDEEMLTISRNHSSPADACQQLVKAAKIAGGADNITAIVVEMNNA